MSFIGSLHELSLYGLVAAIICLLRRDISLQLLWQAAFHPTGLVGIFICYLFWASVLFLPIAIIGALVTKYIYHGEGLMFESDNILVIIFAHIAEEIISFFCTPVWFFIDLFKGTLLDPLKILDHLFYILHITFMVIGLIALYR